MVIISSNGRVSSATVCRTTQLTTCRDGTEGDDRIPISYALIHCISGPGNSGPNVIVCIGGGALCMGPSRAIRGRWGVLVGVGQETEHSPFLYWFGYFWQTMGSGMGVHVLKIRSLGSCPSGFTPTPFEV